MPDLIGQRLQRRIPALIQRRGCFGAIARYWETSYAPDYAGLLLLFILIGLIQSYVEPFHRVFRIDNQTIHYPYTREEHVPVPWLFAFALGIPALVFFFWAIAFRPPFHKIHVTYLGLLTSVVLTVCITDIVKNAVGRPRPDFRERCNPHRDTPRNELVTYASCDQPNAHMLHDGFRSFPSGHSSFAFSGLGYLALFFAAQFHVLHPATSLPTILLTISPLIGAALIAFSRLQDYRHDVYDVSAGTLLGLLIAYITYRRYYPSLQSQRCDTPWPSKSDMMAAAAKWYSKKERDEEERIGLSTRVNIDGTSKSANGGVDASGGESDDELNKALLKEMNAPR